MLVLIHKNTEIKSTEKRDLLTHRRQAIKYLKEELKRARQKYNWTTRKTASEKGTLSRSCSLKVCCSLADFSRAVSSGDISSNVGLGCTYQTHKKQQLQ